MKPSEENNEMFVIDLLKTVDIICTGINKKIDGSIYGIIWPETQNVIDDLTNIYNLPIDVKNINYDY
jgi:hypothetical protein